MSKKTRRLAAIMFTDIVGYTAMMQTDEARAVAARNRHREVFERMHQRYQGKLLQYYGDGTLSIFESAIDAANCAVAIQQELQKDPKVPLRIGIHTGDIIYSEEEAIGNGVNIAARIESLAAPGSVIISERVYEYIKNHQDLPVQSMGAFSFKNVDKPIEVFAVKGEGIYLPSPTELAGKVVKLSPKERTTPLRKIPIWLRYVGGLLLFLLLAPILYSPFLYPGAQAETIEVQDENGKVWKQKAIRFEDIKAFYVSPFSQTEGDSSHSWLSLGIPYALEMEWDQDPYIWNAYDNGNQQKPLNEYLEIAEREEMSYVLLGSYKIDSNSLYQIDLSFYQVNNGQLFKQTSYRGRDLFSLLDSISKDSKFKLDIPAEHIETAKDLPLAEYLTDDLDAYESFCKGIISGYYGNRPKSFQFFDKAIERDPSFAWSHFLVSRNHHVFQRSEQKAQHHIQQAMMYRSRLPDVFEASVRQLNYRINGEPEKALKLMEMLVQLNPRNSVMRFNLIQEYMLQNEYQLALDAIREYQKVFKEPFAQAEKEAFCLIALNKEAEGIRRAKSYLKDNPNLGGGHFALGEFYTHSEKWEEARSQFERMELIEPENHVVPQMLEVIDFLEDSSEFITKDLYQSFDGTYVTSYHNFEFQVIPEGRKLFLQVKNQRRTILYPINLDYYISPWGMSFRFVRNDQGLVTGMKGKEGKYDPFEVYKISTEVQQGIDALTQQEYEDASTYMKIAQESYPENPLIQGYLQHLSFQNSPESEGLTFEGLGGTFATENYRYQVFYEGGTLFLNSEDNPSYLDPIPLYPISKDTFFLPKNIGLQIKIELKGKSLEKIFFIQDNSNEIPAVKVAE